MSKINQYVGLQQTDGSFAPFYSGTARGSVVIDVLSNPISFLYADGFRESSDWTKEAVDSNFRKGVWGYITVEMFNNHFSLNKIKTIAESKSMSSFIISKGKLYFNTTLQQTERVITIQDGSLVWTSRHKQQARAFPKSAFRLATQVEVSNYLDEAGK